MRTESRPSSVSGGAENGGADRREISDSLTETLANIGKELGGSPDVKVRRLRIGRLCSVPAAVVHIGGLADNEAVNRFVIAALQRFPAESVAEATRKEKGQGEEKNRESRESGEDMEPEALLSAVMAGALEVGEADRKEEWNDLILGILAGDTAILIEGCGSAILCGTQGGEVRPVAEPTNQLVVRGPKDSFVESVGTNVSLIRRRLKTPHLRLEYMKIGTLSHTHVALMYLDTVVDDALLEEVRARLDRIRIDAILESGYIEELIQDKTFTPFPTINNTERPDAVAGNLLEGRVAVVVDGTPFVLILPATFTQFFQTPGDYSQRYDIAILMRMIRYLSYIVLVLGPSVYIALTTYHYEMIPTRLLISLLSQRENVPFPAFVEAMLMEVTFEILREAGVRMPRAVGQTVSVVGALILGQAVVEAGIITPVMVIVVALTGISSFAIPSYNMAIAGRVIRFGFMLLAAMFGFYGITLGMIVLVAHMNSLRSFGMPYLTPAVPLNFREQQDILVRLPLWYIKPGTMKYAGAGLRGVPEGKTMKAGHQANLSEAIVAKSEENLTGEGSPTGSGAGSAQAGNGCAENGSESGQAVGGRSGNGAVASNVGGPDPQAGSDGTDAGADPAAQSGDVGQGREPQ